MHIGLPEQKADSEIMKMQLALDGQVHGRRGRYCFGWLHSKLQKQADEKVLQKVTGWLFDDCSIVLNEKKS